MVRQRQLKTNTTTTTERTISMLDTIALDQLTKVNGGAGDKAPKNWEDIRKAARPHCPKTVDKYQDEPTNRREAETMGNACIAEMGSFKASLGGRKKIREGIDAIFPK